MPCRQEQACLGNAVRKQEGMHAFNAYSAALAQAAPSQQPALVPFPVAPGGYLVAIECPHEHLAQMHRRQEAAPAQGPLPPPAQPLQVAQPQESPLPRVQLQQRPDISGPGCRIPPEAKQRRTQLRRRPHSSGVHTETMPMTIKAAHDMDCNALHAGSAGDPSGHGLCSTANGLTLGGMQRLLPALWRSSKPRGIQCFFLRWRNSSRRNISCPALCMPGLSGHPSAL